MQLCTYEMLMNAFEKWAVLNKHIRQQEKQKHKNSDIDIYRPK